MVCYCQMQTLEQACILVVPHCVLSLAPDVCAPPGSTMWHVDGCPTNNCIAHLLTKWGVPRA